MMRRTLRSTAVVLLVFFAGLAGFVLLRWDRTFEAPYPPIRASTDSSIIEAGRYLAYGPAHCAYCHTTRETAAALDRGERPPLAGGFLFELPVGTFRTPNITPDSATGIGALSDDALARVLRYGVRADGRAALPFMNYHDLSDADLAALISFLRSQPPVRHEVAPHDINFLGKTVLALVIKPVGPEAEPPRDSPPAGVTLARGEYLATAVAECADCHTRRSNLDGSYTGPRFAGGAQFPADGEGGDLVVVSPNLTPDPATGRITAWSEDQFVARFHQGKLIPQSPMPWNAFARMTDDDLRSIYRYLRTLAPVVQETGPSLRHKS